ncbi:hypothetical protein GE09DRAFT_1050832 [Coniochaeta sp. 2T2.1]|nr:hypothetical protein GE09DRAFT_1050832 [Coniochaeta sp. 2T2.1]
MSAHEFGGERLLPHPSIVTVGHTGSRMYFRRRVICFYRYFEKPPLSPKKQPTQAISDDIPRHLNLNLKVPGAPSLPNSGTGPSSHQPEMMIPIRPAVPVPAQANEATQAGKLKQEDTPMPQVVITPVGRGSLPSLRPGPPPARSFISHQIQQPSSMDICPDSEDEVDYPFWTVYSPGSDGDQLMDDVSPNSLPYPRGKQVPGSSNRHSAASAQHSTTIGDDPHAIEPRKGQGDIPSAKHPSVTRESQAAQSVRKTTDRYKPNDLRITLSASQLRDIIDNYAHQLAERLEYHYSNAAAGQTRSQPSISLARSARLSGSDPRSALQRFVESQSTGALARTTRADPNMSRPAGSQAEIASAASAPHDLYLEEYIANDHAIRSG